MRIGGRRYIDGGVRSTENADYAVGASRILVIAPLGNVELFAEAASLAQSANELRAGGAEVAMIVPDDASTAVIGTNPLDAATRRPAAESGRVQGRELTIN